MTALKPWVRVVVTLWVVAVIPVVVGSLALALVGLPRLLATVADSAGRQWDGLGDAWDAGSPMRVVAGALATVAVALPAASILYMLGRLVRRVARGLWQHTDGRPLARAGLAPLALLAVAGLAWLWWPNGEYEPLQKGERWTVQETVSNLRHVPSGRPGLTPTRAEEVAPQPTTTTTTPVDDDEGTRDTTGSDVGTRSDGPPEEEDDEPTPTTVDEFETTETTAS